MPTHAHGIKKKIMWVFFYKIAPVSATKHFIYILAEQNMTYETDGEMAIDWNTDRERSGGCVFSPFQPCSPLRAKRTWTINHRTESMLGN